MLAPYRTQLATLLDPTIGQVTALFPQGVQGGTGDPIERKQETELGDLLADALKAQAATNFALINGGGIRAPLPSSYLPADTALHRPAAPYNTATPWDLVKGDVYTVLPFGNQVVKLTITGTELWDALENGFSALTATSGKGRFPQIAGFKVTYNVANAVGSRVVAVTMPDGTTAIPKDATTYTLATMDFVAGGGDGYTVFADNAQTVVGTNAAELVITYLQAQVGALTPATSGRITAQ
jgi:5'-nucleotidase